MDTQRYKDISDKDLLDQYYRTGDNQLLGALLERYSLLLYGFCSKQLHDGMLARDAVQQVQLSVIENIDRARVDNFSGWIFTIARNECNSMFRSRRALYREVTERDALQGPAEIRGTFEDRKEALFDQALAALPEAQQVCIRSFYLSGGKQSYKDVADKTGYSVREVKTYIQNGKRTLKIALDKLKNQYL